MSFDPAPPDGHSRDSDADVASGPFEKGVGRRLLLALIAWPPLGLAIGAVIGDVTGCSRFSASCTEPEPAISWVAQAAIVAALFLLPVVARPAAVASIAAGIASIGAGVILSILGGTNHPDAVTTLLVAILVMAWAVGLIGAISGRFPLPVWLRAPPDD
jgi:hypothetical protein